MDLCSSASACTEYVCFAAQNTQVSARQETETGGWRAQGFKPKELEICVAPCWRQGKFLIQCHPQPGWAVPRGSERSRTCTRSTALPCSVNHHRLIHLAAQTPITFWQPVYGIFMCLNSIIHFTVTCLRGFPCIPYRSAWICVAWIYII